MSKLEWNEQSEVSVREQLSSTLNLTRKWKKQDGSQQMELRQKQLATQLVTGGNWSWLVTLQLHP